MPAGRPKGSSNNSSYHRAGGSRANAGRKSSGSLLVSAAGSDKMQRRLNFAALPGDPRNTAQGNNENSGTEELLLPQQEDQNIQVLANFAAAALQDSDEVEVAQLLTQLARETDTTSTLYYDLNQEDDSESYDSYSDQDENEINDTAVDASHFPVKSDRKGRAAYMPPDGTPLFEYLSGIKRKLAEKSMQIRHNSLWIPPPFDPVAKGIGSEPVPDRWYIGDCWVYLWLPREQFNLDKLKFIYCGNNSTESAGLRYRPMFKWDTIVWCLYQRVRCTSSSCCASNRGKRRQFSTVDPRSLSLLPTSIAERFEFVTTEGRGLGMHRSMIHAFSNLTSKQVLYGSFVNMINELHRIRYSMAHISYLDCLVDGRYFFLKTKRFRRSNQTLLLVANLYTT